MDFLHKLLFPKRHHQIAVLHEVNKELNDEIDKVQTSLTEISEEVHKMKKATPQEMENIMRVSLGLPYIKFHNIEDDGKGSDRPPHYLKGLPPDARTAFIAELSQIYRNPKFKEVMDYHINDLGNNSIQIANDENMRNGRIGIIAFRKFRKEFEDADAEFTNSMQDKEEFDEHAVLP